MYQNPTLNDDESVRNILVELFFKTVTRFIIKRIQRLIKIRKHFFHFPNGRKLFIFENVYRNDYRIE